MQTIIVDSGNSNVKAQLFNSEHQLVQTLVMPSLISKRYADFILGGFTVADESIVVGFDNEGRSDCISMVDADNGKLQYLHYLLAGVVSAFEPHLRTDTDVKWYVLTLNPDKLEIIKSAVQYASAIQVDGKLLKLKSTLVNCFPEGAGAAFYATESFPQCPLVGVLDIGYGTCNLSTYATSSGFPRRASFKFVPSGVSRLLTIVSELLTNETSNGRVDERLLQIAVTSNTNRYFSDYNGRDITTFVNTSVEYWMNDNKLKPLVIEVIRLLNARVPIVLCGGGSKITAIKEALELNILANVPDSQLWLVPENAEVLGVAGLGKLLQTKTEVVVPLKKRTTNTRKQTQAN